MTHNEKSVILEKRFEHKKLFHAHKSILYLSNSKCYIDNFLENEINNILVINNKNIEKIIYFSLNLKNKLRQNLFSDIFKSINEIDSEIKNETHNNELKGRLEDEKKEILNIFYNEIDETVNLIEEHNQSLLFEIEKTKTLFITNKTTPFIYDKKSIIEENSKEIIILENTSKEIKKELDIIRDSESILHKKNFFDLFKNEIPSQSKIESLNIEWQEKSILSSLIAILNNLVSTLDNGFSYNKIVETRHQLTSLYLTKIKKLHQLKTEQQNTLLQLKHYYKLADIDYFLDILIKQLEFLSEYWKEIILKVLMLKNNTLLGEEIVITIFPFLDDFSLYYEDIEKIKTHQ